MIVTTMIFMALLSGRYCIDRISIGNIQDTLIIKFDRKQHKAKINMIRNAMSCHIMVMVMYVTLFLRYSSVLQLSVPHQFY
jgi:hypothetical protein